MHRPRGFTLIELIVLVAMVSIVGLIVLPGLMTSTRYGQESQAAGILRMIAAAESRFKTEDSDGNGVDDYWTADVAGLYCMTSAATPGNRDDPIRLIHVTTAAADFNPLESDLPSDYAPRRRFIEPEPRSGYWFSALTIDHESAEPYRQDTGGTPAMGAVHSAVRFAFLAYPDDTASSGRKALIINEQGHVYGRDLAAPAKRTAPAPPGPVVGDPFMDWPTAAAIKASWVKAD